MLFRSINTGGEGWLGRVGVGCDYQIAPSFVIGAFGDYDFMNLKGTFLVPVNGLIGEEKQTSSWAAGGRIGYLPYPGLMTFVSAGYTEARFDAFNLVTSGVPSFSTSFSVPATTYRGWFLGGGYEYRLPWAGFSGLYWKTEYRYNKYDTLDVPYAPLAATLTATNMQKSVQTITTSLVWKFNWGGPVRAAY